MLGLGLALAAAYHVVAIVNGSAGAGRHALFVALNLLFAAGFWRPFRGFVVLVALLAVQQLASHGQTLLHAFETEQRVDWPSVIVLIAMPLAIAVLSWRAACAEGKRNSERAEARSSPIPACARSPKVGIPARRAVRLKRARASELRPATGARHRYRMPP